MKSIQLFYNDVYNIFFLIFKIYPHSYIYMSDIDLYSISIKYPINICIQIHIGKL
jgi:hypothetical protein